MPEKLSFRWLGVQGLELSCAGQTLAIDPFFTRPPLSSLLLRRVQPNLALAARLLARCDYVLVSHPHYDHILDVPDLLKRSGAPARYEKMLLTRANSSQSMTTSSRSARRVRSARNTSRTKPPRERSSSTRTFSRGNTYRML